MDYSKIFKTVEKSVVNVVVYNHTNKEVLTTATGAIIENGQKVLTCSHCCDEKFHTGIYDKVKSLFLFGKIVFNDSVNDIAIIEFPYKIGNPLRIVKSDSLEIGNEIFTVGYPYVFNSEKTLTVGNIAAFEEEFIKINVSVNNGNSGGPLFNINGEIVGMVNSKLGSLSNFLESIEARKPGASMVIDGVDPVQVIQQMIREMQQNLNLGIGYAIPSSRIASITDIIRTIIE